MFKLPEAQVPAVASLPCSMASRRLWRGLRNALIMELPFWLLLFGNSALTQNKARECLHSRSLGGKYACEIWFGGEEAISTSSLGPRQCDKVANRSSCWTSSYRNSMRRYRHHSRSEERRVGKEGRSRWSPDH